MQGLAKSVSPFEGGLRGMSKLILPQPQFFNPVFDNFCQHLHHGFHIPQHFLIVKPDELDAIFPQIDFPLGILVDPHTIEVAFPIDLDTQSQFMAKKSTIYLSNGTCL